MSTTGLRRQKRDITESYFVRFGALYGLVVYADYFNFLGNSTGGIGNVGKYAYFIILAAVFVVLLVNTKDVHFGFNAPTIFLSFTVVSLIPLFFQILSGTTGDSYATAFVSTLVLSIAIVFDEKKYRISYPRFLHGLYIWLVALGVLYIGELALRDFGHISYFTNPLNQENHLKSLVMVAALCLAILSRQGWKHIAGLFLMIALAEVLRPESTLLLVLTVCIPLTFAIRARKYTFALWTCCVILLTAAALPFALHLSPEFRQIVLDTDAYFKRDLLGGISDTSVRLIIIDLAFDRMESSSWLVGEMFSGATNIQIGGVLSWWLDQNSHAGLAAIHSDYVAMLLEGGILGYSLFNLALILLVLRGFRLLRSAACRAAPGAAAIVAMGPIVVVITVLSCSTNPFLQLWQSAHVVWFLLFCFEIGCRSVRAVLPATKAVRRPLLWRHTPGKLPLHPRPVRLQSPKS